MKKYLIFLLPLLAITTSPSVMAFNPFSPQPTKKGVPSAPATLLPSAPATPSENIDQQVPSVLIGEVDGMAFYRGESGYVFQPLNGKKIVRTPVALDAQAASSPLPSLPPAPLARMAGVPPLPPGASTPAWKAPSAAAPR
jgi:hypothetical protein